MALSGAPLRPDVGGTTIAAGAVTNFSWTLPCKEIHLIPPASGTWYVKINGTAASATDYEYVAVDGVPYEIRLTGSFTSVSVYSTLLSTIHGAGKNCSIFGWPQP